MHDFCLQAHAKGSSLMQPLRPQAGQPSLSALGSAAFQALAAADVAPEADFFQKYQVCPACFSSVEMYSSGALGYFRYELSCCTDFLHKRDMHPLGE